jgi:hypothetical protein
MARVVTLRVRGFVSGIWTLAASGVSAAGIAATIRGATPGPRRGGQRRQAVGHHVDVGRRGAVIGDAGAEAGAPAQQGRAEQRGPVAGERRERGAVVDARNPQADGGRGDRRQQLECGIGIDAPAECPREVERAVDRGAERAGAERAQRATRA